VLKRKLDRENANPQTNTTDGLLFTSGIPPQGMTFCVAGTYKYCLEGFSQNRVNGQSEPFNAQRDDHSALELVQTGPYSEEQVAQWQEFAERYNLESDFVAKMPGVLGNTQAPVGAEPCKILKYPLTTFGGNYTLSLSISHGNEVVCANGQSYLNNLGQSFDSEHHITPPEPQRAPNHGAAIAGAVVGSFGFLVFLGAVAAKLYCFRRDKKYYFSDMARCKRHLSKFNQAIAAFNKEMSKQQHAADSGDTPLVRDLTKAQEQLKIAKERKEDIKTILDAHMHLDDDHEQIKSTHAACVAAFDDASRRVNLASNSNYQSGHVELNGASGSVNGDNSL
jgi:hypothetical protein